MQKRRHILVSPAPPTVKPTFTAAKWQVNSFRPLTGIMHKLSAPVPQSSTLTALCFLGLLGVLHEYACGALTSHALSSRGLRHFVTKTYA
jgi:hypothetical protein